MIKGARRRLDVELVQRGLSRSRSQAENSIKLGEVTVSGHIETKPGRIVDETTAIIMKNQSRYVSRAGLKLASVSEKLTLQFKDAIVLDVGSSTGGFTDYALQHGAHRVYAVDVGTDQLHPSLRSHPKIVLHEKTDIRSFKFIEDERPNIIVIDVSFISLRDVLPYIASELSNVNTKIIAMVKPQFEAGRSQTNKGIIKNESVRRQILRDFEKWSQTLFIIEGKRDSDVTGAKGNQERFYKLKIITH